MNELYDLEYQRIIENAKVQRENLIQRNIDENTTYNDDGSVKSTIDRVQAAENVKNQLVLLEIATGKAITDSINDRIDGVNALENKAIEARIRTVETQMRERQRVIDEAESVELANLSDAYKRGEVKQEEYEKQKLAIARKYADLRQLAELDTLRAQLQALREDGSITEDEAQAIVDKEQEIADLEVEINKEKNDRIKDDNEKALKDEEELQERRKEMILAIANAIFDISGELIRASTDRQLADLDRQSEDAQKAADDEIARIERLAEAGAITEEDKNARIALSEQELAAKQEVIDQQRAEIEKRQARYEILLSTAQAIMSAALTRPFIPLGLIAAGTATAMGAAQLAAVNAAQYAHGTPDGGHRGGLAWVGDGGRAEAVFIGNKVWKTPAVPTLIDLPKGAEVLPDWNEVVKYSLASDLIMDDDRTIHYNMSTQAYDDRAVTSRFDRQSEQMERLIREIRRGRKADRIAAFKDMKITGIS